MTLTVPQYYFQIYKYSYLYYLRKMRLKTKPANTCNKHQSTEAKLLIKVYLFTVRKQQIWNILIRIFETTFCVKMLRIKQ